MEVIKKPLEIDFFFDPTPLSSKHKKMISDFIKADRKKRKQIKISKKRVNAPKVV